MDNSLVIVVTSTVFAIIVCGFGLGVHYAHKHYDDHDSK
jgi:hypothetical protein